MFEEYSRWFVEDQLYYELQNKQTCLFTLYKGDLTQIEFGDLTQIALNKGFLYYFLQLKKKMHSDWSIAWLLLVNFTGIV